MLQEGQPAPAFELPDEQNRTVRLQDFQGRPLVLFFFPKADTPGWIAEASGFRDAYSDFQKLGVAVIGMSADPPAAQEKFKEKYSLPFPLLCDVDRKIVEEYGVIKEKNMYGKTVLGIERTTFLIDGAGKIKKIFPKVKVDGHTEEVLAALNE